MSIVKDRHQRVSGHTRLSDFDPFAQAAIQGTGQLQDRVGQMDQEPMTLDPLESAVSPVWFKWGNRSICMSRVLR